MPETMSSGGGPDSASSSSGLTPVKISQRPSKSCTECIRRKARCNKRIPCELCLKRGVSHLCKLESQFVVPSPSASPVVASRDLDSLRESVFHELESLRRRVYELERGASLRSGLVLPKTEHRSGDGHVPLPSGELPSQEDPATTLEYFSLGVDRRRGAAPEACNESPLGTSNLSVSTAPPSAHASHILRQPHDRQLPDSVIEALLPRRNVRAIINFALANVQWQHCCVTFPRFWDELDAFYTTIGPQAANTGGSAQSHMGGFSYPSGWAFVDPTWLSLLYVIQGVAVHQMTDADAEQCGLAEGDRYVLPNALVAAAEEALYAGNFLSRPTMWGVQAIAILCVCGHNVCESALLSSLLALGLRSAQSLNLHCLGKAASRLVANGTKGSPVVDVELGKRVWWSLTQQDWFVIPKCGVWSVHPGQFDTPLPNNCHDQDLVDGLYINRPDSVVTVAYKIRFASHLATILQSFFSELNQNGGKIPFAMAEAAAARVRSLVATIPAPATPSPHMGSSPSDSNPPWTALMRHYMSISANHKILLIYRTFISRGGPQRECVKAHQACIAAAEAIIAELEQGSHNAQAIWTIPYHGLAAAVVLGLDLMSHVGGPEAPARQAAVERARACLERLAPTSRIARRGLQVLGDLMREAEEVGQGKRRRGVTMDVGQVIKKIKLPANEMVDSSPTDSTFSRVSGSNPTSHGISPHGPPSASPDVPGLWAPVPPVPIGMTAPPMPNTSGGMSVPGGGAMQAPPPMLNGHAVQGPTPPGGSQVHGGQQQAHAYPHAFDFSQQDANQLMLSLQLSVPDVGRLFEGGIGEFNWGV